MPSNNPEIIKKHRDAWYAKNKGKQIDRQMARRKELSDWITEYRKTQTCTNCGMSFSDCPECCDFHHINPLEKDGKISDLVRYSKAKVLAELEKCVSLCANCHRTEHFG